MGRGLCWLAIIRLGAHQFKAPARNAIGLSAVRGYGAISLQLAKNLERQARIAPAIARETLDFDRFFVLTTDDVDVPALREQVEDALFSA